jgi:hypothetical protein
MMEDRDGFLQRVVDENSHEKRPLLLVDQTPDEYSHKFFERSAEYVILDAKLLHRKFFVRKTPLMTLLNECRHLLVYAMMRGKTLVIRFCELAVDFQGTFCDENCEGLPKKAPYPPYDKWSFLPRGFMLNQGELLTSAPYPYSLVRKDDLMEMKDQILRQRSSRPVLSEEKGVDEEDDNEAYERRLKVHSEIINEISDLSFSEIFHPKFRVIVTTTIRPEAVKELLFNGRFGLPTNSTGDFMMKEFY